MKTATLIPPVLLVNLLVLSSCIDEDPGRASVEDRNGFTCEVARLVTEYADGAHEEQWSCTNGPEVIELDPAFEEEHWDLLMSGQAKLSIDLPPESTRSGSVIDASDIEIIDDTGTDVSRSNGANAKTGEGTVLVVRVMATDSAFPDGEAALAASIFGGPGDQVNLQSQYEGCSHDEKTFKPAQGPSINGGVVTVSVGMTAAGSSGASLRNAARIEVMDKLDIDDLGAEFDHVMYCIPPGTQGNWVANATVNHYVSTYNGRWCTRPTAQAHEVGHNLGLLHAGVGSNEYADQTGNMSYSHDNGEGPKRCFNAAKSSQLGWYADKELTIAEGTSTTYTLIGAVDYPEASGQQAVLLQAKHPDPEVEHSIHIAYNVAKGPNQGTSGATANTVTVVEQEGIGTSDRRAALKAGDAPFTFQPFGNGSEPLTVEVVAQGQDQGISFANVKVTYGDGGGNDGGGGGGSAGDNSCADHCGGQAPGGCWCDVACTQYKDCCNDYEEMCTFS